MSFPKGTKVRQIVTPIEGEVTGFDVDQESGQVQVQVEWTGPDGKPLSRYFKADEIEAIA
jgi:hypothetical protein